MYILVCFDFEKVKNERCMKYFWLLTKKCTSNETKQNQYLHSFHRNEAPFHFEKQFKVFVIRSFHSSGRTKIMWFLCGWDPSSIYSWSIGHILEHEFFCLGSLGWVGSKEKKVDLSFSEQFFRVVFSTFLEQKFIF